MDLYQPQGVGRRKRKAQNNEDGSVVSEQTIISPVRQKRSDGYDRDRQKTLSLAEGGRGKGEAIFMREDRIITEKPRLESCFRWSRYIFFFLSSSSSETPHLFIIKK